MINDRFVPEQTFISTNRDTATSSTAPLPPQDVLFRSKNAPPYIYEENNPYLGNLPNDLDSKIPDSDLLKAIHAYAADYYSRSLSEEEAEIAYNSLDGSALLALGMLLEESCAEVIGETGDLALVEGVESNELAPRVDKKTENASASPRSAGETNQDDDADIENRQQRTESAMEGSGEEDK